MSPELWDGDLPEVERGDRGDEADAQPGDCPGQVEVAEGGGHQRHQPAQDQRDAGEDDRQASSASGDQECQHYSSRRQGSPVRDNTAGCTPEDIPNNKNTG